MCLILKDRLSECLAKSQNRKEELQLAGQVLTQEQEKSCIVKGNHSILRGLVMITVLMAGMMVAVPVVAADGREMEQQLNEDCFTLAQITEMVQQHNRVGQQYQLNLDLLEESQTKVKNVRYDVHSTLDSVYDNENSAYNSLGNIGKNQATVKQEMQQLQQQIVAENPGVSQEEIQKMLMNDSRYLVLQAQMTALSGSEAQINSGIVSAENAIEELWDGLNEVDTNLRTLENKADDVVKSQADWNEEVKLITNLLVREVITMEHTEMLLEQKYALMQKQYQVAQKKEEVGLTVPVKTKEIQISLDETATQLQQVGDGVQLLKRQINDMMGRSLDATLNIVPISEIGYVSNTPVYHADLLKQAIESDYTLKTLQRDIANYKEDAQDLKDEGKFESDTLKINDLNIELSKVSIENEEVAIDNDLKKLINAVNVAGQTYNEKLESWHNAKTKYQQNQKYKEVGLLSPLLYQAAELELEQAALNRQQADYDYALTKLEYEAFLKGIDLNIYEKYKSL